MLFRQLLLHHVESSLPVSLYLYIYSTRTCIATVHWTANRMMGQTRCLGAVLGSDCELEEGAWP